MLVPGEETKSDQAFIHIAERNFKPDGYINKYTANFRSLRTFPNWENVRTMQQTAIVKIFSQYGISACAPI